MVNVSNTDDVIDSRDVIERIEELEAERTTFVEDEDDEQSEEIRSLLKDWDEENGEELTALKNLADEGANESSDWAYGETLIHYDHFTEYTQQTIEDVGDLPRNLPGYIVIDWEQTAENLKVDYSTIDFDGQTYYIRNS